jgi:hypothetical protein
LRISLKSRLSTVAVKHERLVCCTSLPVKLSVSSWSLSYSIEPRPLCGSACTLRLGLGHPLPGPFSFWAAKTRSQRHLSAQRNESAPGQIALADGVPMPRCVDTAPSLGPVTQRAGPCVLNSSQNPERFIAAGAEALDKQRQFVQRLDVEGQGVVLSRGPSKSGSGLGRVKTQMRLMATEESFVQLVDSRANVPQRGRFRLA